MAPVIQGDKKVHFRQPTRRESSNGQSDRQTTLK